MSNPITITPSLWTHPGEEFTKIKKGINHQKKYTVLSVCDLKLINDYATQIIEKQTKSNFLMRLFYKFTLPSETTVRNVLSHLFFAKIKPAQEELTRKLTKPGSYIPNDEKELQLLKACIHQLENSMKFADAIEQDESTKELKELLKEARRCFAAGTAWLKIKSLEIPMGEAIRAIEVNTRDSSQRMRLIEELASQIKEIEDLKNFNSEYTNIFNVVPLKTTADFTIETSREKIAQLIDLELKDRWESVCKLIGTGQTVKEKVDEFSLQLSQLNSVLSSLGLPRSNMTAENLVVINSHMNEALELIKALESKVDTYRTSSFIHTLEQKANILKTQSALVLNPSLKERIEKFCEGIQVTTKNAKHKQLSSRISSLENQLSFFNPQKIKRENIIMRQRDIQYDVEDIDKLLEYAENEERIKAEGLMTRAKSVLSQLDELKKEMTAQALEEITSLKNRLELMSTQSTSEDVKAKELTDILNQLRKSFHSYGILGLHNDAYGVQTQIEAMQRKLKQNK